MNLLEIFICLVKHDGNKLNKALRLLFKCIYNGQIYQSMKPYFNNTYLFSFYKDEKDPSKICPIGVPNAMRQIVIDHIATVYGCKFAHFLLPYNWAIGTNNGMDFIAKDLQFEVKKYITIPQHDNQAPSKCLISLDLINIFNEISRDKVFQKVEVNYPSLIPLVAMLY